MCKCSGHNEQTAQTCYCGRRKERRVTTRILSLPGVKPHKISFAKTGGKQGSARPFQRSYLPICELLVWRLRAFVYASGQSNHSRLSLHDDRRIASDNICNPSSHTVAALASSSCTRRQLHVQRPVVSSPVHRLSLSPSFDADRESWHARRIARAQTSPSRPPTNTRPHSSRRSEQSWTQRYLSHFIHYVTRWRRRVAAAVVAVCKRWQRHRSGGDPRHCSANQHTSTAASFHEAISQADCAELMRCRTTRHGQQPRPDDHPPYDH